MIIGLTGRKQAGKNACARLIRLYAGREVVEVSFAALLKQSAAAVLGCEVDDLERWKNDPHALVCVGLEVELGGFIAARTQTVREFLQRYGTEGHRDLLGPDFWVDAALPSSSDYSGALYVVTDVRFPNEARRVKALGGTIVRIIGPPEIEDAGDAHASETPLPDELVDIKLGNVRRDDGFAALDFGVRLLLRELDVEVETSPDRAARKVLGL